MGKACGKVILAGEHAVVYDRPALALGLENGAEARATPSDRPLLEFARGGLADGETLEAYKKLLEAAAAPPMHTRVELTIPHGVGLGASAAVAVAIARAVHKALGRDARSEQVLEAANAWERVFHGNPSGIDTASALVGGCIRFSKPLGWQRVNIGCSFELAVAVAGPPSPTREMIAQVARIRDRNLTRFEQNLDAIESLVRNAEQCLLAADFKGLGQLLDYNQMLLAAWLLSTPEIEQAVQSARQHGALGAKLTGAGGGGCVIALPGQGALENILDAWRRQGFEAFSTRVMA